MSSLRSTISISKNSALMLSCKQYKYTCPGRTVERYLKLHLHERWRGTTLHLKRISIWRQLQCQGVWFCQLHVPLYVQWKTVPLTIRERNIRRVKPVLYKQSTSLSTSKSSVWFFKLYILMHASLAIHCASRSDRWCGSYIKRPKSTNVWRCAKCSTRSRHVYYVSL